MRRNPEATPEVAEGKETISLERLRLMDTLELEEMQVYLQHYGNRNSRRIFIKVLREKGLV